MMAKLFDADALFQTMKNADEADPDLATCWSRGSIRRIIEGLPTIEAAPVVHGRWVHHYYDSGEPIDDKWYCSECHMCNDHKRTWYCPNCGAKMDGGVSDG